MHFFESSALVVETDPSSENFVEFLVFFNAFIKLAEEVTESLSDIIFS